MDIAEKRLPQDGRIRVGADDGQEVTFRASTLRTIFGEKVVLRVLDNRKGCPAARGALASRRRRSSRFASFLRHQHGHDPPSSGRPAPARRRRSARRLDVRALGATNIITIEDPVEYQIPWRQPDADQRQDQADVRQRASARSCGQDPTSCSVGEIRDQETARIAMQAAPDGAPRALDAT
jgi:type II secretory ATPase GspE/PulE/Tfp pilus assembly ATPase PilB-like protein